MRDKGTETYHTVTDYRIVIIGAVIIIGLIVYVGFKVMDRYNEAEDYCNEKFGVDNWTLDDTSYEGENIGAYKCISKIDGVRIIVPTLT
jgi:hypothetical protein